MTVLESEMIEPDQYLGPMRKRITYECERCGHVWTRIFREAL